MSDSHPMHERWLTHGGARLYAVEAGAGVPLILLHGGLADHRSAWRHAAALPARARVITPDLRGAGRSHHRGPLTWDLLADDVAAWCDELGLAQAIIGGTSFGAGVAVRAALRHPTRVAALLVLHPAFAGADHGLTPAQDAAMRAMAAVGARCPGEGMAALDPLLANLPAELHAPVRAMWASFDPESVARSTAFMVDGGQPFVHGEELAAIAAPTLLVPGVDPTHPRSAAEVYARHLPRVTVRDDADLGSAIASFLDALG